MINCFRSSNELFCKVAHLTVPSLSLLYKEAAKWAEEAPYKLRRLFLSTLSLDNVQSMYFASFLDIGSQVDAC